MARLREAMVVGTEVVLIWDDAHQSYYPAEELRRACPCAGCKGEEHLFGAHTPPTMSPQGPDAFRPVAVHAVGNYGLQITWADGHDHGIYHLEQLRAGCPCCREEG